MKLGVQIFAVCLLTIGAFALQPAPYEDHCLVDHESQWPNKVAVPEFEVNLDLPPYQRWQTLAKQYTERIVTAIQVIKNWTNPLFHGKIIAFIDKYMGNWNKKIRQPYRDEIFGIANATGLPVGDIVLYNLFYEIHSACTSVVAKDLKGELFHGRNMDFGMLLGWNTTTNRWKLSEHLRALTADVKLMKGGKVFANMVTFIGYVGAFNGMKPNAFTVTMNTRFANPSSESGLLHIVEWLLDLTPKDMEFSTFHARSVIEKYDNFLDAKNALINVPIMGPCYYIMGGVKGNEAAIIARSPLGAVDIREMGTTGYEWFTLQTNYDQDKEPIYLDDRRTPGRACMRQLGQSRVSMEGLYQVLGSKTTLNKETVLTVMMQPSSGYFRTYHRVCEDPCWPW